MRPGEMQHAVTPSPRCQTTGSSRVDPGFEPPGGDLFRFANYQPSLLIAASGAALEPEMGYVHWIVRISALLAILITTVLAGQPSLGQVPSPKTTRCDCRPEFDVVAEGRGTCEIVKDDTRWCKIKFNDGTRDAARELASGRTARALRRPRSA